ncbi:MAG: hypothetical protein WD468_07650 [Pirellulales bacterium]
MMNSFRGHTARRLATLLLASVSSLSCVFGAWIHSAPAAPPANLAAIFDMDGANILHEEAHLGIVNGKLAAGVLYRDVAGISGLWSPPYVSSNFALDGRVDGQKVPTENWTWRPFQVDRAGALGDVAVTTKTTLIYGHRAAIVSLTFKNSGNRAHPLEFFAIGWLDKNNEWGFAQPRSRSETTLHADGRLLTLRQGPMAIVVAIDSEDWKWDASGNLGRAFASLPANESRSVNVVVSIGAADEAIATANKLLAKPAAFVAAAEGDYRRQVSELFEKLPAFSSDNEQFVRWYNRSLVHLLMNRWDLPDFVLNPYYSTGSVNGGCVANYLWNFGEPWEIFPLFDPAAARSHIIQFLKTDLLHHYNFLPLTGAASGPWYMINQEKIVGLVYYYVLLTGDTAFLDEMVDGKSIRDHMVIHAMYGDDASKPIELIDYGDSNSHLELRRGFPYNHISPDLNARRYATYQRASTLCDLAGKPVPVLRERAALLKPLLKQQLWDSEARWFRFQDNAGKGDFRYTIQMFKPIGSGVLDQECEAGLLSHLNEDEFLSAYGLHSLSKRDPAYDQFDIDNGGGGACTCFPPQIIERLYQAGQPKLAAEILNRLLWWADSMPYWGDSIAANAKDYRQDTPLQCTLDGSTAAQCVIFGVFGVGARQNGDIIFKPNELPFATKMNLTGLKIRGHNFDVRIDGPEYEVRTGKSAIKSALGKAVVFSAASGQLQAEK